MSKSKKMQLKKTIINDIQTTITELRKKGLIRDERGITTNQTGANSFEISFDGKSEANSILFDKHVSASYVMNTLLQERQYIVLMYDKGIVQAEFCIDNGQIVKERLFFMKKHNRVFDKEEIAAADAEDEDWFGDEESIPIFLRIDYDPISHVECDHPVSHLTLANNESCRIPIQDAISFSEFIVFILFHFYDVKLDLTTYRLEKESTITNLERKMLHIGWEN